MQHMMKQPFHGGPGTVALYSVLCISRYCRIIATVRIMYWSTVVTQTERRIVQQYYWYRGGIVVYTCVCILPQMT